MKHGPSTLIISIPSRWAKKYGIKQGDELDVDEQESRLVIDTKGEKKLPELRIDVSNLSKKLTERFLINAYQLGHDKINITYSNPKICSFLNEKIQQLLGYEIIERSDDGCVIKNIATKIDLDFDKSLKKIFLLVNGIVKTTHEAYKNGDKKLLKNLHYKDIDVNKFAYFCLRTLNKQHYVSCMEEGSHVLYHLIIRIENLADYYKKLSKMLSKIDSDKDIEKLLFELKEHYNDAFDFFYEPQKDKLSNLLDKDKKILKLIKKSFGKTKTVSKLLTLTMLSNINQSIYKIPIRTLNRLNINEDFIKEL